MTCVWVVMTNKIYMLMIQNPEGAKSGMEMDK